MNKYLSDKLRIISLISIMMVVLIHSYNVRVNFNSGNTMFNVDYNAFIQNFFSQGITRIAVPFFFCISGYLFYININGKISEFIIKYKKRAKSLLLPYLLWSIWGLLFYFFIQLIPQSKNILITESILNYSVADILKRIILHPIPYQLWFVKDLMVLVVFSPLIYWIIRCFKIVPIVLLFVIWLGFFKFSFFIFTNESILFFFLGAYFAICKSEYLIKKLNKKYFLIVTFIWILIVFLKTTFISQNSDKEFSVLFLHQISIMIGLVALWSLYDIIMVNNLIPNKIILKISCLSFFIYAFHEPILTLVKSELFYIIGTGEGISMVVYFLAPTITILLSILLGGLIKINAPKFYGIITGGR